MSNSKRLIMCHGLPGSGKSTWAARYVEANPGVVVVNKDVLRTEVAGEDYHRAGHDPRVEKRVAQLQCERLEAAFTDPNVLVAVSDDTNLDAKDVKRVWDLAEAHGVPVEHKYLDVPVSVCKERNHARAAAGGRLVPENMIDAMAVKGYDEPIRLFGDDGVVEPGHIKHFVRDERNGQVMAVSHIHQGSVDLDAFNQAAALAYPIRGRSVVILDADGTLFNNKDDSRRFLNRSRPDFPGFYRSIVDASVNQKVLRLVQEMRDRDGLNIILVTGRSNDYARALIDAVSRSGAPVSRVIMKRAGDARPSSVHKEEALRSLRGEGLVVVHAVDDRGKDIAMFERNGVMVSRVAEPDSDGVDPDVDTVYGSGRCIRCGRPLSGGGSIGRTCRTKMDS